VRVLCDHHVPPKVSNALRSVAGITVATPAGIDDLGGDADDTEIIAYAEAHGWVVFTNDQYFLVNDEGENPSYEPIDADCGVIYYTQNTVGWPGTVAEAIQAVSEAFADHSAIDLYINDWIDRNR
jgi:hypothetical protein